MYKAPFHRQILPWLYVAIFLATAPVLIFYTAGYRWNQKKGEIERNGTLIVDSTPKGAKLFLDDADTGEFTPITIQNMVPGWHRIRIERAGYQPWEKSLEVRAEQVTFANNLWLWRTGEPELLESMNASGAWSDPADERLLLAFAESTGTSLGWWSSGITRRTTVPGLATTTEVAVRWRTDGGAVLLNGHDGEDGWWAAEGAAEADRLPTGMFRWAGRDLQGIDGPISVGIRTSDGSLNREKLPTGTVDRDARMTLSVSTTSQALLLTDESFLHRAYSLPPGHWRFAGERAPFTLMRDGDRWLAVRPGLGYAFAGTAQGDEPHWLSPSSNPTALLINRNEVWVWRLGEDGQLLWRQSEPIVQALWHRSGTTVFLATRTHVFAISLDDRNGRLTTPLADFDAITGMAMVGRDLYVTGMRQNRTGLWRIVVE